MTKLWHCSWIYPVEVQLLGQYREKHIILASESEEALRLALAYWAESWGYVLLDLKITYYKEIEE